MTSPPSAVTSDTIVVEAKDAQAAEDAAHEKIVATDHHHDDRIEPSISIDHLEELPRDGSTGTRS